MMDTHEREQRIREGLERDKRRAERKLNDMRKIVSTAEGRRFIWDLLSEARIFHSSYTGNSDTYFNEGKRNIGLGVLESLMRAKPDAFTQMQNEAASDPLRVSDQKGNA